MGFNYMVTWCFHVDVEQEMEMKWKKIKSSSDWLSSGYKILDERAAATSTGCVFISHLGSCFCFSIPSLLEDDDNELDETNKYRAERAGSVATSERSHSIKSFTSVQLGNMISLLKVVGTTTKLEQFSGLIIMFKKNSSHWCMKRMDNNPPSSILV